MGMALGTKKPQSDINVTPLIDVVLVLLIIFMVLTPLAEKQKYTRVPEYQPEAQPVPPDSVPPDQTVLTALTNGTVALNKQVHDAGGGRGEARAELRRPPVQGPLLQRRGQGQVRLRHEGARHGPRRRASTPSAS